MFRDRDRMIVVEHLRWWRVAVERSKTSRTMSACSPRDGRVRPRSVPPHHGRPGCRRNRKESLECHRNQRSLRSRRGSFPGSRSRSHALRPAGIEQTRLANVGAPRDGDANAFAQQAAARVGVDELLRCSRSRHVPSATSRRQSTSIVFFRKVDPCLEVGLDGNQLLADSRPDTRIGRRRV